MQRYPLFDKQRQTEEKGVTPGGVVGSVLSAYSAMSVEKCVVDEIRGERGRERQKNFHG